MSDTQHDAPVGEDSASSQSEDSRAPETPGMTMARLLANPRRIRRA